MHGRDRMTIDGGAGVGDGGINGSKGQSVSGRMEEGVDGWRGE